MAWPRSMSMPMICELLPAAKNSLGAYEASVATMALPAEVSLDGTMAARLASLVAVGIGVLGTVVVGAGGRPRGRRRLRAAAGGQDDHQTCEGDAAHDPASITPLGVLASARCLVTHVVPSAVTHDPIDREPDPITPNPLDLVPPVDVRVVSARPWPSAIEWAHVAALAVRHVGFVMLAARPAGRRGCVASARPSSRSPARSRWCWCCTRCGASPGSCRCCTPTAPRPAAGGSGTPSRPCTCRAS